MDRRDQGWRDGRLGEVSDVPYTETRLIYHFIQVVHEAPPAPLVRSGHAVLSFLADHPTTDPFLTDAPHRGLNNACRVCCRSGPARLGARVVLHHSALDAPVQRLVPRPHAKRRRPVEPGG